MIHTTTAKTLAEYEADYYKGSPAVTVNAFGKGKAYYICSENEDAFFDAFYRDLVKEEAVAANWPDELPEGVTVSKRVGKESLLFIQNFNEAEISMDLAKEYRTVAGETVSGTLFLKPFDCVILIEK